MELLDIIKLKETDTLYILGDVLDRGPRPIKVLLKLMEMLNVWTRRLGRLAAICLDTGEEFCSSTNHQG